MLQRSTVLVAVAAVALAFAMAAAAQGPAAAPGPAAGISDECLNAVLNMSDCLTYVTNGSTVRHPDKACCPELAGLLESHPICLCQLLAGGADSYGVSVDYKRALALPGICRLTAPPVSACAGTHSHVAMTLHSSDKKFQTKISELHRRSKSSDHDRNKAKRSSFLFTP